MKTLNDFVTCHQRIADLVIHNRKDLGQGHGMAAFMVMVLVVNVHGGPPRCTIIKVLLQLHHLPPEHRRFSHSQPHSCCCHGMVALVKVSVINTHGGSLRCTIMKALNNFITCHLSIAGFVIHNHLVLAIMVMVWLPWLSSRLLAPMAAHSDALL